MVIRLFEHTFMDPDLRKEVTEVSVLAQTSEELARVAKLPGKKAVFDMEGVVSRGEAHALLGLARQPQPDRSKDPRGWGDVEAFRLRCTAVPLPSGKE